MSWQLKSPEFFCDNLYTYSFPNSRAVFRNKITQMTIKAKNIIIDIIPKHSGFFFVRTELTHVLELKEILHKWLMKIHSN